MFCILVWSWADAGEKGTFWCWLADLTNQGLLIEVVYLGFAAITTYAALEPSTRDGPLPWYGAAQRPMAVHD